MASRGLEYAVEAVRDFLRESLSGTPRLDAEVDAIEDDSPSETMPDLLPVGEYLAYQDVTKQPVSCQVYGDEMIEPVDSSNGHSAARYRVGVVLMVHVRAITSHTPQRASYMVQRYAMALRRCLQGASVTGALTTRQAAQTLNGRVLLSQMESMKYTSWRQPTRGNNSNQHPLEVRARLWVRPQVSNQ